MSRWLDLGVHGPNTVSFPLFLLHVVKDCMQPQLVVALRDMPGLTEETLHQASTLDTSDMLSFGPSFLPSTHLL